MAIKTEQTTPEEASPATENEPVDAIAELLGGSDEQAEAKDEVEESPSDESTDEKLDDEPADELEEASADDDLTWGKALGIPEEALAFNEDGDIAGVNVKINGKQSSVGMGDLIKGYQNNKSYTENAQALSVEKKQFEEVKNNLQTDYTTKLENVELITNHLTSKLLSEFDGINWDQLRTENPAEYAAARQDYNMRAQELQQAKDAIDAEKQTVSTKSSAELQEKQKAYMTSQFSKMIEANPTWSDQEVLAKDMTGLKSFAGNQYGFSDQDFSAVTDARLIELLKDAKAYHEGVKVATAKRKKPVPKFQRSTRSNNKTRGSKLDQLTKTAKAAKGANQRDLQTDAIAELLSGV